MSKAVDVMEAQPLLVQGFPSAEKTGSREWRGKWWHLFGNFDGNDVSACCLAWKFPCVAWAWNQNRGLQYSFIRELLRFVFLSVALVIGLHFACCLIMTTLCPQALPPRPEHGDFHGRVREDDDFDGPHVPEECLHRLVPAYITLAAVALAAAVSLALFFARRRTAIRERFAIQGSTTEDAVMYLCCAPCALAQETRTLMHEQVHGGVWYGALPGVQAPPAFAAPGGQKMSA